MSDIDHLPRIGFRGLGLALLAGASVGGCFSEGVIVRDLTGTVVVPREAATQTITVIRPVLDATGNQVVNPTTGLPENTFEDKTITDVRMIGPVYVGLFPGMDYTSEQFPHPERGPQFQQGAGLEGDTYPYGGTTIGDVRFACLEFLSCKVISGRFVDFEDLLSWFNDTLETPILDASENEVSNGDFIRQTCYDILEITSDDEIRVTATEDRNQDGTIDGGDLDFVENADGDFEAPFEILQAEFYEGFSAWAWVDTPLGVDFNFTTCDGDTAGFRETTYSADFYAGLQYQDLLNRPSRYIFDDDWVASRAFVWDDALDAAELVLDFSVADGDIAALREELKE